MSKGMGICPKGKDRSAKGYTNYSSSIVSIITHEQRKPKTKERKATRTTQKKKMVPDTIVNNYLATCPALAATIDALQNSPYFEDDQNVIAGVHGNSFFKSNINYGLANLSTKQLFVMLSDTSSILHNSFTVFRNIFNIFDRIPALEDSITVYRFCAYFKEKQNGNQRRAAADVDIEIEFFVPTSATISQDYANSVQRQNQQYFTFIVERGAKVLPTLPLLIGRVGSPQEMEVLLPSTEHANYEVDPMSPMRFLVSPKT